MNGARSYKMQESDPRGKGFELAFDPTPEAPNLRSRVDAGTSQLKPGIFEEWSPQNLFQIIPRSRWSDRGCHRAVRFRVEIDYYPWLRLILLSLRAGIHG